MNHRMLSGPALGIATTLLIFGTALAKSGGNGYLRPATPYASGAPIGLGSTVVNFDVTGIDSNDSYGSPLNEVFNLNVGANSWITGIGWDVTIYADDPSWLSDMTVALENSVQSNGVFLTVGVGDNFSGSGSYSSGGIVDLVGLGLQFQVGADGKLRLEFFESYDDFPDDWDGYWKSGKLAIEVTPIPEPSTYALMLAGLAGLAGTATFVRRRRN